MDILRILRKQRGWSQKEVASRVGVSRGAVAMWESGRSSPDADMLVDLAKLFGTTIDTLLGSSGSADGNYRFPIISSIAAPAAGSNPREIVSGESVDIPASWLCDLTAEEFLVLRASGFAMWPDIQEGDLLLVQRRTEANNGCTAVVFVGDQDGQVRELSFSPGGGYVDLVCRNPEYPPKRLQGDSLSLLTIYGEVIGIIRRLKKQ